MKGMSTSIHSVGRATASGGPRLESEATFRIMRGAFEQALSNQPERIHESWYGFARYSVLIRVVGRSLAKYTIEPFAHLQTGETLSDVPALTIELWDESETGVSCPVGPLVPSDDRESIWQVEGGGFASSRDRRFVSYEFGESRAWLDRKQGHIVGWTRNGERLSLYERGKPHHRLLSVWYNDRNVQIVHAGVVSRDGHGVLFAGSGGSGKSTSTLACVSRGFGYLGDDYIGLQALQDDLFVGHSLYNSAWLEPGDSGRFPFLLPHVIQGKHPANDKLLILLSQVCPGQLHRFAPIRALVLPRVAHAPDSRLQPASKGQALLALAPSSILALVPSPGEHGLDRLVRLVEHVPAYRLELGYDLQQIPNCVEQLLAKVIR